MEDKIRTARDGEGNYAEEKASVKYPEWEEKYLKENEKEGIMNIESFSPLSEKQVNDFQRKSNELFRTLTQDELRAFEMYTGSWYLDVNDYLLKKKNNNNFLDKIIDTIESVMDEFETDENILAYRGIKDWHYGNIQIGDVIETGMFTSTSLSESVAKDFARSTVFEIEIPKGTKGIYIGRNSAYPHEREFLLSHKLKYKVLRREGNTLRLRVIKND